MPVSLNQSSEHLPIYFSNKICSSILDYLQKESFRKHLHLGIRFSIVSLNAADLFCDLEKVKKKKLACFLFPLWSHHSFVSLGALWQNLPGLLCLWGALCHTVKAYEEQCCMNSACHLGRTAKRPVSFALLCVAAQHHFLVLCKLVTWVEE